MILSALVIGSDRFVTRMITTVLTRAGWSVRVHASSAEVPTQAQPSPNLLVASINEPQLLEVWAALTESGANLRVLLLTEPACGGFQWLHQVTDARLLPKPFSADDLLTAAFGGEEPAGNPLTTRG